MTGVAQAHAAGRAAWHSVQDAVHVQLTRRLDRASCAPIAVAFSGGGDSLALLLLAKTWADQVGRALMALTVDHKLQRESAAWARECAARAARLGVEHRTLIWPADKPRSGLAAAAREARHALLATAAREAGARVLLMGHTLDDSLEARLMREAGGSVSEPRDWSPSPAWPEGRDLFLLRPLLAQRRADLRAGLMDLGECWVEDPANDNPQSARARARRLLSAGAVVAAASLRANPAVLFEKASIGLAGDIAIPAEAITGAPDLDARAFLGAAILCASGRRRPPRLEQLARLLGLIRDQAPFVATLAEARMENARGLIRIMRDSGAMAQREDSPLIEGRAIIFDDRFAVTARRPGWRLGGMRGRLSALSPRERRLLQASPPAARRTVPALIAPGGEVHLAGSGLAPDVQVLGLGFSRLAAACGAIENEVGVERVAKPDGTS